MRGDQAMRLIPQRTFRRQRLRLGDVQSGTVEPSIVQGVSQGLGIDGVATPGIDHDGCGFQTTQTIRIQQMMGLRRARHRHRHHVCQWQQRLQPLEAIHLFNALGRHVRMTAHAESTHTYGLGKLSEMRPDVTDADNQRDATFRAQYRSFILPLMITLIGGIPVEVLHQCPHGGEHVFRHALAIRAARIGDHGAARQHTRADVRIRR